MNTNYVLQPLSKEKMEEIFDKKAQEIISYFIRKSVDAQPELKKNQDKEFKLQVPKEYFEQWCVQAIDAKAVGAGSYAIDILLKNNNYNFGADIKSLSINYTNSGKIARDSGEASLSQKFKETGVNLDNLFKTKDYEEIKKGWLEIVKNKNIEVQKNENIDNIYYFVFLQGKDKFYLCGLEVFIDNLEKVQVDKDRTTDNSVFLNSYIDSNYGNIKIYKAKKRLELRLHPDRWIEENLCLEFDIPSSKNKVNLREKNLSLKEEIKVSLFTKSPVLDIFNQVELQNFFSNDYEIFDFLYNYDDTTHGYLLRKTKKQLKFKKDLNPISSNNLNQNVFDFNQTKELFNEGYVIKEYEYNDSTGKSKFKFYK